jgi:transposase
MHPAVDAHGMPVRVMVTAGSLADCTQAEALTKDLPAGCLPDGKGCDTDAIVEGAQTRGLQVVIPPRSNRRQPRHYDACLHKLRHLVENAFLRLKQWRGIATRHARRSASFLAAVQFRCALLRAQIL